ncbi:MAG: SWIM zinc finger family protein [Caldilineaceae bacterium]
MPNFTQDEIRSHAGSTIYARGYDYYEGGAVEELVQRGDTLYAEVAGSEADPYTVTIHFTPGGIGSVDCSCPYGGWCKHVVATLLTALEQKSTIENRPTVAELIKDLSKEQLSALVIHLAGTTRTLSEDIEAWAAQQQLTAKIPTAHPVTAPSVPIKPAPSATLLDAKATKTQIRKALKGFSKFDTANQMLDQVSKMMTDSNYDNAYLMLDILTDEFVSALPGSYEGYYDSYDEEGDDGSFDLLPQFDSIWAELILSSKFSQSQLDAIEEKLNDWNETVEDHNGDTAFDTALLAVEYGWDYAPLQRALAGEITEKGAWEDEAPAMADELALVRLRILERQGRTQEYLNLAQAEGQFNLYLLKLVQMGRFAEATVEAIEFVQDVNVLFEVVMALHQQGAIAESVRVAKHGLVQQEGLKYPLAKWLYDHYSALGDQSNALPMLVTMLAEQPTLTEYQRLHTMASDEWPSIRTQVLDVLRNKSHWEHARAKAEIFLSEQLWDDAIALVNDGFDYTTLEFVMDQVYSHRPDWVIQQARRQAESIMDAGKADRYEYAVQWLQRVKKAYQAVDRSAEWNSYFQSIRNQHQRKYKLMALLGRL